VSAGDLGEIESKPSPAASDIEHTRVRFDPKLRGQVASLGELRIIERLVRSLEIGAAILLIGVEEERVEPAVEIVMVRYIAPGPRRRIELLQSPKAIASEPPQERPAQRRDVVLAH
jgi:hypothetical protein